MKYLKVKYFLMATLLITVACDDFLDLEPENDLIKQEFWNTKEDVISVMAAAYDAFRGTAQQSLIFGELRADMAIISGSVFSDYERIAASDITSSNEKVNDFIKQYFDISDKFIEGYEYYVFYNTSPSQDIDNLTNTLVYSKTDINLEAFNKIIDNYNLPENIKIVLERDLISLYNDKDVFYTKKLETKEKLSIQKQINSRKKIYATKDILALL